MLGAKRLVRTKRAHGLPALGGSDERDRIAGAQIGTEIAGAPQRSAPIVTAAALGGVGHGLGLFAVEGEGRRRAAHSSAAAWAVAWAVISNWSSQTVSTYFWSIARVDRLVVAAEVNGGTQAQAAGVRYRRADDRSRGPCSAGRASAGASRARNRRFIAPHRQAGFQAEFGGRQACSRAERPPVLRRRYRRRAGPAGAGARRGR